MCSAVAATIASLLQVHLVGIAFEGDGDAVLAEEGVNLGFSFGRDTELAGAVAAKLGAALEVPLQHAVGGLGLLVGQLVEVFLEAHPVEGAEGVAEELAAVALHRDGVGVDHLHHIHCLVARSAHHLAQAHFSRRALCTHALCHFLLKFFHV